MGDSLDIPSPRIMEPSSAQTPPPRDATTGESCLDNRPARGWVRRRGGRSEHLDAPSLPLQTEPTAWDVGSFRFGTPKTSPQPQRPAGTANPRVAWRRRERLQSSKESPKQGRNSSQTPRRRYEATTCTTSDPPPRLADTRSVSRLTLTRDFLKHKFLYQNDTRDSKKEKSTPRLPRAIR
jgi:hypothetical protein